MNKVRTGAEIADIIQDGAVLAITGAGGGLVEPDALLAAIEARFLATGHPRDLTVVHAQGLGDGADKGLNRLAWPGLVRRVIGAHWAWSPRMQALAADNAIEAYALPGGVIQHLAREVAAGRPGLITPIGLGTLADPRFGGGRMNARATQDLSELIAIDGREYLRYRPIRIDVAILRATQADPQGALSLMGEGAELDALVLAMAARNCGGIVLAQCRELVQAGSLPARWVRVPGAWVDAVLLAPEQVQSYLPAFDPSLTGCFASDATAPPQTAAVAPERAIVGARAVQELHANDVVSFGIGFPDEVTQLAFRQRDATPFVSTLDHGHYGGEALKGALFGFVRGGAALIDSPSQFDFYSGGGIDIAYLGFGEIDAAGNVNVSRLNGRIIGPGGFIEITQGARRVVFCGAFETGGLKVALHAGRLAIVAAGRRAKLVDRVEQVTFSGARARTLGQTVLYVTERCVFELTAQGMVLTEVAPGARLREDILERMGFAPLIPPDGPAPMRGIFTEAARSR